MMRKATCPASSTTGRSTRSSQTSYPPPILRRVLLFALVLVSCTDVHTARVALRRSHLVPVHVGGKSRRCCPLLDRHATNFRAVDLAGDTVVGCVCGRERTVVFDVTVR